MKAGVMSHSSPKSIRDEIEMLARLTGAPPEFVEQVRALFLNKAISLDEDATPYSAALEEAFRREEEIRSQSGRIRRNLAQIRESLVRSEGRGRDTARGFGRVRDSFEENAARLRENSRRLAEAAQLLRAGRRVVRDIEVAAFVPGPKELQ